ncbi:hypothetical protein FQN60_009350 [Etheostoma spectabile]|uniref:Uncharacterized protein n=1 Tax=Etheostoma spectabile TaxID=54343 RepID=A0A5J5DIN1_9PERO|nr:hypothetical protein FQN60_009350 [Etheostoma spectabile]
MEEKATEEEEKREVRMRVIDARERERKGGGQLQRCKLLCDWVGAKWRGASGSRGPELIKQPVAHSSCFLTKNPPEALSTSQCRSAPTWHLCPNIGIVALTTNPLLHHTSIISAIFSGRLSSCCDKMTSCVMVLPRAVHKHRVPASNTTHPQVLVTHIKEPTRLSGSISTTVGETRVVFCSQHNRSVPPPTPLVSLLQTSQETHQSSPVPTQEHRLICFNYSPAVNGSYSQYGLMMAWQVANASDFFFSPHTITAALALLLLMLLIRTPQPAELSRLYLKGGRSGLHLQSDDGLRGGGGEQSRGEHMEAARLEQDGGGWWSGVLLLSVQKSDEEPNQRSVRCWYLSETPFDLSATRGEERPRTWMLFLRRGVLLMPCELAARSSRIPMGKVLNTDLRHYLSLQFQKGSLDHKLQQIIRDNLYLRTIPFCRCLRRYCTPFVKRQRTCGSEIASTGDVTVTQSL